MALLSATHPAWRRIAGIVHQQWFLLLAMALLVTAPLVYYASHPVRLVEIHFIPTYAPSARIPSATITTRAYGAVAYFQIEIENLGTDTRRIALQITPEASAGGFTQGTGYVVENGHASGRAQLGSETWPVTHDEQYVFRVADAESDVTLLSGIVVARVDALASPTPWIFAALGGMASLIQLFSTILSTRKRTDGRFELVA